MRKQPRVMVCVTGQLTCERLIHAGAQIAAGSGALLSVVHVARMGASFLGNPSEGEALEYLFSISKEYDADMTLLRSDDIVATLAAHARKIGATCIVMGGPGVREKEGYDLSYALRAELQSVDVRVVHPEM